MRVPCEGMHPFFALPALVQPAPQLPAWLSVPAELELKPDGLDAAAFDLETFEVRDPTTAALIRIPVEGRTWRFVLRGAGARMGALSMMERLRPSLESAGWVWTWPERGIARRNGAGPDAWFRATAGAVGELRCVLIERSDPPLLVLVPPGPVPERPRPEDDFPYLAPWPGAKHTATAPSQTPVGVRLFDGRETIAMVNWIEKEYELAAPITPHAFLAAYRAALLKAGWEIEGTHRGPLLQLQAVYAKGGRDLRAILRFAGDVMGISVADVGAQVPKEKK